MANENIYHVQQKSTQLSPNDVPLEKDWNGHSKQVAYTRILKPSAVPYLAPAKSYLHSFDQMLKTSYPPSPLQDLLSDVLQSVEINESQY